ncbi:hypothetical protein [Companilactobacillus sp.]|jgi:hypothetical protein|uniref:hypothetical protein n=1 Tax=Companilactobacillus sp. TaxID=2767905 RepID=UPI0025BD7BDE|nr:hypothetical protein [Companilactobacillus sp.]MCH4009494.1 hypothetical protein [Companilactobacillus sp.]MCH4052830.1 hypothetical protein [Companilactobacillus sp.]MCH4077436.1 hypothetical protein [Companilactobacillus sp.]MCH4126012.1 hypothetical protein [Companilactobacillus sp.]MCI1311720.1 hypothetical protein [Companilactobacillus sp.]
MSNKVFTRVIYGLLVVVGLSFIALGILNTSWGHSVLMGHYVDSTEDISKSKLKSNKKIPTSFDASKSKSSIYQ